MEINWFADSQSGQWALFLSAEGSQLRLTPWLESQEALVAHLLKVFGDGASPSPGTSIPLPEGYFGPSPQTMNEVDLMSTITEPEADPPILNIGSARDRKGSVGLGGVRFGIRRDDGILHGVVMIQGKIDERDRHKDGLLVGGEVTVHIAKPGFDNDARWVPFCEIRHDGVKFLVPVYNSRGQSLG
jgi:hypothetical protein